MGCCLRRQAFRSCICRNTVPMIPMSARVATTQIMTITKVRPVSNESAADTRGRSARHGSRRSGIVMMPAEGGKAVGEIRASALSVARGVDEVRDVVVKDQE